jgi:RAD3-like DEAD/DEAH box helicase/helicase-like protein
MPTSIEGIEAVIDAASAPGFRGRLLARGQSRAMIWREGQLPQDAPAYSPLLSYDLHSYGYSLLGQGLRLRELGGDPEHVQRAFEQAATALEAVIARGNRGESDRDFHFVMAASAYHLARLSARAYSLLTIVKTESNFSPIERTLAHLMLRELGELETLVLATRAGGQGSDRALRAELEARLASADLVGGLPEDDESGGGVDLLETVDRALIDNFFAAMAIFLLALERGENELREQAVVRIREGLTACAELNMIPQWWAHRVAEQLIDDLWECSFHEKLPRAPIGDFAEDWSRLRELFIALLFRRERSEIDLWPSQIAAAARAVNLADDLVVSLPTSAGKTRIAELCILRCLAARKRVIFVTPLRALSAQTEVALQRTFGPLGKTISALYGSIGVSGYDEDAFRERHIVVATPEKLDFALRSEPSLLDDVGLLVFDEGHMIGLSEREVRYELQIQRLLRRPDANQRRIVCLSAILPDGEQMDDFMNWLRRDQPGGLVKSVWRPTRLRYGEVIWNGDYARLNLRVGDERPFVPRFLSARLPPIGKRKKPFPADLGELCLATAWRLVADGQSVLLFCPVRAHVEPFADRVIDLYERGALTSLLVVDEGVLRTAISLGEEWLGAGHPILRCLRLGVAIHHGALPTAYRKEVERLLREGVLKVTISSPTLAQGLNLSATVVIFHSLFRNRERIKTSEFKNVVGRAGRAFVDVEGLVLYPIFDNHGKRSAQWEGLIADLSTLQLESGLLRLVGTLLARMHKSLGKPPMQQLAEYVLNNADAWTFPEDPHENPEERARALSDWNRHIATLDTGILSLLGESNIEEAAIAETLDEVLRSSLWERRLRRRPEAQRTVIKTGLLGRTRFIWGRSSERQRRGYFLAGVGLATGMALDAMAGEANALLVQANAALLTGDHNTAVDAITAIAERVFVVEPFAPEQLPEDWRQILRTWLLGLPLAQVSSGREHETLQFVEGGLVYRLPWAMEAIRVRGLANGDTVGDWIETLDDFDLSWALAAVETGTVNRSAAILIQAGFSSRLAAIKAVGDTQGVFTNASELREWLFSDLVEALSLIGDWPTPETNALWEAFRQNFGSRTQTTWKEQRFWGPVSWRTGMERPAHTAVRILDPHGTRHVVSADGLMLGQLEAPLNPNRRGLLRASVMEEPGRVLLTYLGPEDLWLT